MSAEDEAVEAALSDLAVRDPAVAERLRADVAVASAVRAAVGDAPGPRTQRRPAPVAAPRFSVVVPVLNEEANLPTLFRRVADVFGGDPYELVIVDDGSTDASTEIVRREATANPAVKLVELSRNFGHQAALSAGLDHATGDCVVFMDADLQDPPELLPQLVERWEEGYDVVYAVRRRRRERAWKRASYFVFYRIFRRLADIDIALDSGDFALIDRQVADALRSLPERNRFLRGLRSWVGFRQVGVEYDRPERHAGAAKYTLRKLLSLAADGILAFSSAPLRLASYLGFATALGGVLYLSVAVVGRLWAGAVPRGWTSEIAISLIVGGVNLVMVGVVGEYVARVYDEAKRRPPYIVRAASTAATRPAAPDGDVAVPGEEP